MTQRTYSCVGVDKNGRVEIIANDQGNRTIPSYVSIAADERIVGDAARKQFAVNVKNTVFDAKRLIGRRFSDPVVREVMKHWSFEVVRGDGDKPLIQVEFEGKRKRFTPEEISSMVLTKMRETVEVFMGKGRRTRSSRALRTSTTRSVRRRRTLG